jgi:hypothetical protein
MNFYNWYAGNHCYPKCPTEKILRCREKIQQLMSGSKINTHKDFINLIRNKYKICNLSPAEYMRNVYKEPLCHHINHMKAGTINDREKKIFQVMAELTLILIWLSKFSDQQIDG